MLLLKKEKKKAKSSLHNKKPDLSGHVPACSDLSRLVGCWRNYLVWNEKIEEKTIIAIIHILKSNIGKCQNMYSI